MKPARSARLFYALLRLDHGRIHAAWKVLGWACGRSLLMSPKTWAWGKRRNP